VLCLEYDTDTTVYAAETCIVTTFRQETVISLRSLDLDKDGEDQFEEQQLQMRLYQHYHSLTFSYSG